MGSDSTFMLEREASIYEQGAFGGFAGSGDRRGWLRDVVPASGGLVRGQRIERDPLAVTDADPGRCTTRASGRGRRSGRIERHAEVILGLFERKSDIALAGRREASGARLLFLPPCSPDPIENAFAKLKGLLRKAAARSIDNSGTPSPASSRPTHRMKAQTTSPLQATMQTDRKML